MLKLSVFQDQYTQKMFKNEKERFLEIGYNKLLTQNKLDYLIKLSNRLANIEINTQTDFLEADKENLKKEAADLIYHLMVLLEQGNLSIDDVCGELMRRRGISGHEEKKSRK